MPLNMPTLGPLMFAAVAIVAIGVAIYEFVSERNERLLVNRRPERPPAPDPDDSDPDDPDPDPDDRGPDDSDPDDPDPDPDDRGPDDSDPDDPDHAYPGDHIRLPKSPSRDSPQLPNHISSEDTKIPANSKIVPCSDASDNNLRRRNLNQKSPKHQHQENSNNTSKIAPTIIIKKSNATSGTENNPDWKFDEKNYCSNMYDKLVNDTKKLNEDIKNDKVLRHNIYEEESDSSEDNLPLKDEVKLINKTITDENNSSCKKSYKRKRRSKNVLKKMSPKHVENKYKNCSDKYQSESSSDSQSDNSAFSSPIKDTATYMQQKNATGTEENSKSKFSTLYQEEFLPLSNVRSDLPENSLTLNEDDYKRELIETLKSDVQGNDEYNSDSSIIYSPEKSEKESSESKFCEACEENHINARTYPCNHSYLCVECAVRIFRIYKKCKICHGDVEEYVQFAP